MHLCKGPNVMLGNTIQNEWLQQGFVFHIIQFFGREYTTNYIEDVPKMWCDSKAVESKTVHTYFTVFQLRYHPEVVNHSLTQLHNVLVPDPHHY